MGTYRDLLISTGGGIIGTRQMDEQEKCATIAIGLGIVAQLSRQKSKIFIMN